jgi:hypothetical protein
MTSSTFSPQSRTQEFTTGATSSSTATTPQWPAEWDEDQHNATWGQHDMSGDPDIPVAKFTNPKTVGTRRPLDKDDE